MEDLGLTIGGLALRSGIDTETLVALLFGQEEMRASDWLHLSEALDVPLEWILEGVPCAPRTGPEGRGFYEIEPRPEGPAGPPSAGESGDVR